MRTIRPWLLLTSDNCRTLPSLLDTTRATEVGQIASLNLASALLMQHFVSPAATRRATNCFGFRECLQCLKSSHTLFRTPRRLLRPAGLTLGELASESGRGA